MKLLYFTGGQDLFRELIKTELKTLGLDGFEHPIFYNGRYGIRFQIGVGKVYGKDGTPRKEYVENALFRAITILNRGIKIHVF